ncbi:uncharacterized protein LOC118191455 [Stegodyphus dumicola]|uniref:uncharacterized protein LOC118191455 n=1 Tax=Stegodyphus dumicola TaxID=202533 RepID=UPI0015AAC803|nr:uncharacterized protein LOC118191455 [Stegodyphus dumicola]
MKKAQCGFTKEKSTIDALHNLQQQIHHNKQQGLHTCAISSDVTSAFNQLWWPALRDQLKHLQCPKNLFRIIGSYPHNRKVTYQQDGVSVTHDYYRGAPHGSSIGPKLCNLIANTALDLYFEGNAQIQAYANGFILIIQGGNRTEIQNKAKKALDLITDWSFKLKLKFSIDKTKMITFTKGNKLVNSPPRIKWQGRALKNEVTLKYLGFLLDRKLTWVPHLTMIRDKTCNLINILNRTVTGKWNLKGKLLKELYLRGIERMILYGSPHLDDWHDLKAETECGTYRLVHFKDSFQLDDSSFIDQRSLEPHCHYTPVHPSLTKDIKWLKHIPKGQDLEISSDGSKVSEQVGAAYVAFYNTTEIHSARFRLSDHASVFQAESFALKKALSGQATPFFHPSASTRTALNKNGTQAFHISSLKEVLITLSSSRQVSLCWVRSHQGTQGNERADSLNKEPTSHPFIDSEIPPSIVAAKHKIFCAFMSIWQARWDDSEITGRHTYSTFPVVSTKKAQTGFLSTSFHKSRKICCVPQQILPSKRKMCLRCFSFFSRLFIPSTTVITSPQSFLPLISHPQFQILYTI